MRRTPPKSRVPAERVRVVVHPPRHNNGQQRYAESPGYSGHNGGSFDEAGYSTGQGVFGFRHHTMTTQAAALGLTPSQADALAGAYFPLTTKEHQ